MLNIISNVSLSMTAESRQEVTEALTNFMALILQKIKWKITYFFVQQIDVPKLCGAFKSFINTFCE